MAPYRHRLKCRFLPLPTRPCTGPSMPSLPVPNSLYATCSLSLQTHRPSHRSSNRADKGLPQDLCTYCPLCLEHCSLASHHSGLSSNVSSEKPLLGTPFSLAHPPHPVILQPCILLSLLAFYRVCLVLFRS